MKQNLTLLKSVIRYLINHATENITLQQIAEACATTETFLREHFKEYCNQQTVKQLQRKIKLKKAIREIRAGKTVKQIHKKYGYNNQNAFYKSFKQTFKLTPTEYIQKFFSSKKDSK